jgi:hypothetical protein
MNLTDRVRIPQEVLARQVGGETVMLDLAKGAYFGLDPVGARMWQLLAEGKTLAEVRDAIVEEYDVSREDAERDLLALVADLMAQGLLVAA